MWCFNGLFDSFIKFLDFLDMWGICRRIPEVVVKRVQRSFKKDSWLHQGIFDQVLRNFEVLNCILSGSRDFQLVCRT